MGSSAKFMRLDLETKLAELYECELKEAPRQARASKKPEVQLEDEFVLRQLVRAQGDDFVDPDERDLLLQMLRIGGPSDKAQSHVLQALKEPALRGVGEGAGPLPLLPMTRNEKFLRTARLAAARLDEPALEKLLTAHPYLGDDAELMAVAMARFDTSKRWLTPRCAASKDYQQRLRLAQKREEELRRREVAPMILNDIADYIGVAPGEAERLMLYHPDYPHIRKAHPDGSITYDRKAVQATALRHWQEKLAAL